MARHDISYDFEDFGMDQVQLEEKYGAAGHPEYTLQGWQTARRIAPEIEGQYNGYWDWVVCQIEQDDEDIPSNE